MANEIKKDSKLEQFFNSIRNGDFNTRKIELNGNDQSKKITLENKVVGQSVIIKDEVQQTMHVTTRSISR